MKKIVSISFFIPVCILVCIQGFAQQLHNMQIGQQLDLQVWSGVPKTGKEELVILDFWSKGCSSCIAAFPHMQQLQEEFGDQLKIVLVNSYENDREVNVYFKDMNERLAKSKKPLIKLPELTMINGDSLLRQAFPHTSIPHHVWLNGQGKVLAITPGYNATAENIRKVLNGKRIDLVAKIDLKAQGYDAWKEGLFHAGSASLHLMFYTGFVASHPGMGAGNATRADTSNGTFRRSWINSNVLDLYNSCAYQLPGQPPVRIALKNKNDYKRPKDADLIDAWNKKYQYSYEMLIPLEEKDALGTQMLSDLNRFFEKRFRIEGVLEKTETGTMTLVIKDKSYPHLKL